VVYSDSLVDTATSHPTVLNSTQMILGTVTTTMISRTTRETVKEILTFTFCHGIRLSMLILMSESSMVTEKPRELTAGTLTLTLKLSISQLLPLERLTPSLVAAGILMTRPCPASTRHLLFPAIRSVIRPKLSSSPRLATLCRLFASSGLIS